MFEVIIPVVNIDLALSLLGDIERNSLLPRNVIIIDNTPNRDFYYSSSLFRVDLFRNARRLTTNESWNMGIKRLSSSCEYVSILNDDLIIGKWFFERVLRTFKKFGWAGIVCPKTVDGADMVIKGKFKPVHIRKREGFAFTIKKTLLDRIPPIPKELKMFFGDDFIFLYVKVFGFNWARDEGNTIYHYSGASLRKESVKYYRMIRDQERVQWNSIMKNILMAK